MTRPSLPPGQESLRVAADSLRLANDRLEATLGGTTFPHASVLVYVAGRYTATDRAGVERNIAAAIAVGLEVAKLGACPVIPHSNTGHEGFEHVQPYAFWIAATMSMLRACHALITVPGWEASSGARGEVADAIRRGMPVLHSPEELAAWLEEDAARGRLGK